MASVASITVRDLPDEVRKGLRQRDARAGHSKEAEIREILTDASLADDRKASSQGLREWVEQLYNGRKPSGVVDELLAQRLRQAPSEDGRRSISG
jgi:plasmid stability protein